MSGTIFDVVKLNKQSKNLDSSGTIFDVVAQKKLEEDPDLLNAIQESKKPEDKSFLKTAANYGKTLLKGGIEGVSRLGRVMGPTYDYSGKTGTQQLEEQTETLDYLLPTEEGYGQASLRRGLREGPTILATPGTSLATIPRIIAAGFLGEGAKELGAPEWAQAALEITAFIGPDITKKLLSSGKNKEIIDAAKKLGFTDEQLTPLLQSDFKEKWLSKLAKKTGKTQEKLGETKSALSRAYTTLQESEAASIPISEKSKTTFFDYMSKISEKMPSEVRNKIKEDLSDLLKKPITGESLMNFYADINHYLGDNAKQLSLFKPAIKEAIHSISPQLGKDFDLVNNLYSKYSKISSKLKPNIADQIINAVEYLGLAGGALKGMIFGDYSILIGAVGESLARKVGQEMLTNPRFQQIGQKMRVALNENKYGLAVKMFQDFKKELGKVDSEIPKKIEDISEEDFKKLFSPEK